jgi:hypothetical protein
MTFPLPRHLAALLPAVLAAVALGAPAAHATTPSNAPPSGGKISWSVQPSTASGPTTRNSFAWTNIKPRTVIHDYAAITNYSAVPVTFQVYATDAFTTGSGTLDLLPRSQKARDIGSWVSFQRGSVTVPAHARVNEPFTLTVPQNATPGDHTGGVLASISQRATSATGQPVLVDRRVGVPIHLRVVGPIQPALRIDSVSTSYHGTLNPFGSGDTFVAYTVHNTGNVSLTGTQAATVTGPFGATLATAHPPDLPNLSPGDSFRVHASVSGVFPAGPLTVHVQITPTAIKGAARITTPLTTMSHSVGLWAPPWPQLLLLVVIIGGGVGVWSLLRWWRRARQRVIAAAVEAGRRQAAAGRCAESAEPITAEPEDPGRPTSAPTRRSVTDVS